LSVNINNTHGFTNNKREKLTILVGYGREREKQTESLGEDPASPAQRLLLFLLLRLQLAETPDAP
jgi:hypothetical protein